MSKLGRRIIEDLMVERLEKNRLIAVSGMSIEELTDAFMKGYRLASPKAAKDDVPDDLRIAPKNTTNWIPVSERLPEDIRPVIVTWKNNDPASYYQYIVGKHFIGVAHYLKGKWYWYSSTTEDFLAEYGRYEGEEFDEAIEVIAWMPLPKPYEPQESEKVNCKSTKCENCINHNYCDYEPQESDHKCHSCKHYTSGEHDGSCGSYICKEYSNWESEEP